MAAFVLTYTTLVALMKAYANRGTTTDSRFNDNIPAMIARAENKLAMRVKTLVTRETINDACTLGNPILVKPSYWRNTVSIMLAWGTDFANIKPIFPRTKEFLQTYWQTPANRSVPKYYGDFDENHWYLAPSPAAAYPVQIVVDQAPRPLSDSNQTNGYTEKAPAVIEAACFLEADIFLQNWKNLPGRQADLDQTIADLTGERIRQVTDRSEKATA